MAKSRPRKNQSERSDFPCYIIIVVKNNRPSLAHTELVEDAIRKLVEWGRVLEVLVPPLVVNP